MTELTYEQGNNGNKPVYLLIRTCQDDDNEYL